MADQLSKARFGEFRSTAAENGWHLQLGPAAIPRSLASWLDRPTPCDDLGAEILREISREVPIAGYSAEYSFPVA
jgi:hypothetical protein